MKIRFQSTLKPSLAPAPAPAPTTPPGPKSSQPEATGVIVPLPKSTQAFEKDTSETSAEAASPVTIVGEVKIHPTEEEDEIINIQKMIDLMEGADVKDLRDAERAAKEAGVFDRLHLWPDHRALGSQAVLHRQSDPHAYLKWLNSYWNRISEWPGKTA